MKKSQKQIKVQFIYIIPQVVLNHCLLRVDERNSDSYIGRDDVLSFFFSRKVPKFVQAQIYFFTV